MAEIDYALAWHFKLDGDPRNLQLRFRRNWATGRATVFDGTGQLVAVVIHPALPTTSRPTPSAGPTSTSRPSRGHRRLAALGLDLRPGEPAQHQPEPHPRTPGRGRLA